MLRLGKQVRVLPAIDRKPNGRYLLAFTFSPIVAVNETWMDRTLQGWLYLTLLVIEGKVILFTAYVPASDDGLIVAYAFYV